jgi:HK97 family phage major capsid protein
MNRQQKIEEAKRLFTEAKDLLEKDDIDAQEAERRDDLIQNAKRLQGEASELARIEKFAAEYEQEKDKPKESGAQAFRNVGHWLVECHNVGNPNRTKRVHPYFAGEFNDPEEKAASDNNWLAKGSKQRKDLVESVGATGGFLVPVEFRPELLSIAYEDNPIRDRATIIPMRRRQLDIPTLDQTNGAAGVSAMHGGIVASWTEEAAQKDETEPSFRQVQLVAHKLVCYTEISDELLADEAIGLVAFLNGPMGFGGAIRWEEEYTFLQGTGAGQPLGIVNAGATITVARQTTGTVTINDLFQMLENHTLGTNAIWHINRSFIAQILGLNGPAGNPSYVFIDNAREGLPARLFGYPIQWTEKLPAVDEPGSVALCDWQYYLIGDRQAITVASSTDFRFRNDLTAWRAVHRVDGKPWLSEPITLADGTDQISPFVILGGGGS